MITDAVQTRPIEAVAADLGIAPAFLERYGEGVAKIRLEAIDALAGRPKAKYVVVTAVTPTPLGEGKTVTTIGLGDGLRRIGRHPVLALRQGSMGPTFGIKGGGAGGGRSRLEPFDRVLLHLTGDMHAVSAAHNLLAALVDNHLFHGNALGIDAHRVTWPRVLDVDDRALRNIVIGLGSRLDGVPRQASFDITAASEVMAILALGGSLADVRARLGRIIVATTSEGAPVTADDLHAAGAMAVILRDAVKPNLVQTREGTPALVHAGPFGNIAHGNSSILADLIAIHAGDVLVTEAGFGADMGAERFFNIKSRVSGLRPDAAVVVATVRALKLHSGRHHVVSGKPLPPALLDEHPEEVVAGACNLQHHLASVKRHGIPAVIAINHMPGDYPSEIDALLEVAAEMGTPAAVSTAYDDGGEGATDLAEALVGILDGPADFHLLYDDALSLSTKIDTVAREIYGASGVDYTPAARRSLAELERLGFGRLPVCIAKTQLSLSHDPTLVGAPTGFTLPVGEVHVAAGAGFVTAIAGDMRTMPGLPTHSAAERIDIDANGEPVGLY
jgi:formate--tetrahydrofolate ligase